jgi:hypothetical protein
MPMSKKLNIALMTYLVTALVAPRCPAPNLPGLRVPDGFGVNIHFTGQPRDLDLIADAGFKFIRMDLTWAAVERKKGVYEFEKSGYDALTEGCTKRGIRILYILDYSNRLYESDRSVRTDEGRRAFAAFAEAAAKRYSGKKILWEIWNEPNIKQFWQPQPSVDDYCKLVEQTAPRIRQADPSGLVVAGATSGIPFGWLEECFKKGLLQHIDVLSVHPYRSKPPETVIADYAKLRELVNRHGPAGKSVPIISGEWGYSNVNWDRAALSDETQAHYLVRMFLINLSQKIPVSIWYDWKNDGTNPEEREHNFGTVEHNLDPKAAYRAAKLVSSTLRGYSVAEQLDMPNKNDFALRLTKGRDSAVAFWTIDQEHKATLPKEPGEALLVDLLGGKTTISWKTDGLELSISQSPQYLLIESE